MEAREHVGCFLELDNNVKDSDVIGVSFENLVKMIESDRKAQLTHYEKMRSALETGIVYAESYLSNLTSMGAPIGAIKNTDLDLEKMRSALIASEVLNDKK